LFFILFIFFGDFVELVQYIVVNNSLGMGKGKIAAQAAHASVSACDKVSSDILEQWKSEGMKKIVLKVDSEEQLLQYFELAKKQFRCALIQDAGRTQIASGTKTCFGCGPVDESKASKIFSELKLL
jgi:PTH2 family peptidyl-tRNA hydrolase